MPHSPYGHTLSGCTPVFPRVLPGGRPRRGHWGRLRCALCAVKEGDGVDGGALRRGRRCRGYAAPAWDGPLPSAARVDPLVKRCQGRIDRDYGRPLISTLSIQDSGGRTVSRSALHSSRCSRCGQRCAHVIMLVMLWTGETWRCFYRLCWGCAYTVQRICIVQ